MGYLLKEALKTLCGVNQWSYAVFWKLGCQNPNLLIWEDCYYEPTSWSGNENRHVGFQDFDVSWLLAGAANFQAGGEVQMLVNKMMLENRVNVVGEGLVGRVAFTGHHQWILSENFYAETHPPEVLKELWQQFSDGMQTVAVIPVLPHGVVQFGSFTPMMENSVFVNDVTSLIHQLGHVSPGIGNAVVLNAFDTFNSCPSSFSQAGEILNGFEVSGMFSGGTSNTNPDTSWVTTEAANSEAKNEYGGDLFDVLGADFRNKLFNSCWSNEAAAPVRDTNPESGILEAIVSKIPTPTVDDTVSCKTTLSSSSVPTSLPNARFGKEESGTYSQGSQISSWIRKEAKPTTSVATGHSKKAAVVTGKTNRKRLKPGENPRPRPKDRQMIQDRMKELREIVPNGAKCSIDALLERTIKHMIFLQSVTKHADIHKQTGEPKIMSKDGGLLLKDNFEGGATWAYEVGSRSMMCPIIIEDLNQPRQMLVEMLCEEKGLFLEIADIIRQLGLTILKGVMETRGDKIWARFAVEANRDMTRMEIFISLVRLLEQSSRDGVAAVPNDW